MLNRLRPYALLFGFLSFTSGLSACSVLSFGYGVASGSMPPILTAPPLYSVPETTGAVSDVETQQPLAGVIVVGYWELKGFHQYPVGLMMVQETVTDAQGRFVLPAWGPKARTPITGQLRSLEPELLAFKSGYRRQYERADPYPPDPRLIKLKRVPEDSKEYRTGLSFLESELERFAFFHHDCSWKQVPRLLIALDQEKTRFLRAVDKKYATAEHVGILSWDKSFSPTDRQKCGSMMDFLRSYLP